MKAAKIALALFFAPATAGLLTVAGCSSAPSTPTEKANLEDAGTTKLKELCRDYPDLQPLVQNAAGYVIFPSVGSGGLGISGAGGRGTVYEGGKYVGTAGLTRVNIGLTIGAEDFTELLVFKTPQALADFKGNKVKFDAKASAVALKKGAMTQPNVSQATLVFTKDNSGLMADASIGGQQFTYTADPSAASMGGGSQMNGMGGMNGPTTGPSQPGM